VGATAESDQHFEFLHELGKTIAFPRPGADRAFLFTKVGIAHKSLPVWISVGFGMNVAKVHSFPSFRFQCNIIALQSEGHQETGHQET
jgi:hypothetical protein